VSDDQAVFTEPLAAAFQILRQAEIGRDTRVAVLGDGRLGLLCAMVLQGRTSDLILIGRHPAKLALGSRRGIPVAQAGEVRQRRSYHVVVDATGSAEGFEAAMRLVRPRGTIVLKSTFAGGAPLNLAPLVVDEVQVIGSRCGPFPDALEALASGEIDPTDLISARYPLRDGLSALRQAARPENIKVLIDMV
jgi:threonine dehydrogenase-like Zn-dependent dehydrogenase